MAKISTETVRDTYASGANDIGMVQIEEAEREFDAWLAEHDAQILARFMLGHEPFACTDNPWDAVQERCSADEQPWPCDTARIAAEVTGRTVLGGGPPPPPPAPPEVTSRTVLGRH